MAIAVFASRDPLFVELSGYLGEPLSEFEDETTLVARLPETDIRWLWVTPPRWEILTCIFFEKLKKIEKQRKLSLGILLFVADGVIPPTPADYFPLHLLNRGESPRFLAEQWRRLDATLKQYNLGRYDTLSYAVDLELARTLHQRILQTPLPSSSGLEVAVEYRPHLAVGGDFYAMREVGRGQFVFLISDAVGHGFKAAMITMVLKSLFEDVIKRSTSPSMILAHINREIIPIIGSSFCGTAFCCCVDLLKGTLSFSNAAHPPQILWRGGAATQLLADSVCLGIFEDEPFDEREMDFLPGDTLVLFTDGVYEFIGANSEVFGLKRFLALLPEFMSLPISRLPDALTAKVQSLHLDQRRKDDINLVAVHYPGMKGG